MTFTRTLAALLLAPMLSFAAAPATAAPRKPAATATKVAKAAKKKAPAPAGGALWTPPAAPPPAPAAADDNAADVAKPAAAAADSAPDAGPAKPSPASVIKPPEARTKDKESAPPAAAAAPAGPPPDLDRLRADYDRLRDDLFKSRARAQIVGDALYKSKLAATFRWKGAPDYLVHHASIKLDGAEIWDSGDKAVTDDLVKVAERGVKAGPHAISLRIEIRPGKKSQDSDRLGYSSEHTFAIIVPDGERTTVEITGDEDGDAPEYEPEIEVEVESEK